MALALAMTLASSSPELVTERIVDLKPSINKRYAARLGRLMARWSDQYELDPELMVAIVKVESNFVPAVMACWQSPRPGEEFTCDHGLGQINDIWVKQWNLDVMKLVHDESYNLGVVARLLAQLKQQFGDEPDWFGRYHSNKPARKAGYIEKLREAGFK